MNSTEYLVYVIRKHSMLLMIFQHIHMIYPLFFLAVLNCLTWMIRNFDDILIIDKIFFENIVLHIYPSQLTLNQAYSSWLRPAFLNCDSNMYDNIVFSKVYDKGEDSNLCKVNYPHFDGDCPRATFLRSHISHIS